MNSARTSRFVVLGNTYSHPIKRAQDSEYGPVCVVVRCYRASHLGAVNKGETRNTSHELGPRPCVCCIQQRVRDSVRIVLGTRTSRAKSSGSGLHVEDVCSVGSWVRALLRRSPTLFVLPLYAEMGVVRWPQGDRKQVVSQRFWYVHKWPGFAPAEE